MPGRARSKATLMKPASWFPSLPILAGISLVALFLGPAWAHPVNLSAGEFYAGMMHPVTGLDHLLPVLALALLASQAGKKAARVTLLAFPLSVLAGAIAGSRMPAYGLLQTASLLVLVVVGGMIVLVSRVPRWTVVAVGVLNGLILGYRSGNDMAFSRVCPRFIPGVALTGFILLALVSVWVPVASTRLTRAARGVVGGAFIVAGVLLLGSVLAGPGLQSVRAARLPGQEELMAVVKAGQLSATMVLGALFASFVWGAGHALTPGHGKAIVAAYLIGSRSTPWHALFLGLTVTLTHTLGVFVLGLIALFASQYVLPETLYPWLGTASGLVVVWLGAAILLSRTRRLLAGEAAHGSHSHSQSHSHGDRDDHGHDPARAHAHEHPHHEHLTEHLTTSTLTTATGPRSRR